MKHLLRAAVMMTFAATMPAAAPASAPGPAAARPPLEQEFRILLQEMADARWALNAKGAAQSKAVTERTLADTYVEVLENGDTRTRAEVMENRTPEGTAAAVKTVAETQLTVAIEDVRVRTYGNTATVSYLKNSRLVFNGEPVVKLFRCTETFIRREGRWQSVLHTETVVPGEPATVQVGTNAFSDYVGEYRLTPSVVYTVSREGDRLYWGRSKQELVPENGNTFLFRRRANRRVDLNTSYRVIFVRDDKGQVTHLRMREFPGVEYSAIKIR